MLIEINGEMAKLLEKTKEYNGAVSLFNFGDHTYVNSSDLINIIDNLLAEISRQEELIVDYAKKSDEQYLKMKNNILLSELDEKILQKFLYETDYKIYVTEDHFIEKDELFGILQDVADEFKKQSEEIRDYKQNSKPLGDFDTGWSVALCYQSEMESLLEFITKKGLKEEYERNIKS